MYNEPLGLPAGSVRAILVIMLTVFIMQAGLRQVAIPEAVTLIWIGAVGYYIGYKQNN